MHRLKSVYWSPPFRINTTSPLKTCPLNKLHREATKGPPTQWGYTSQGLWVSGPRRQYWLGNIILRQVNGKFNAWGMAVKTGDYRVYVYNEDINGPGVSHVSIQALPQSNRWLSYSIAQVSFDSRTYRAICKVKVKHQIPCNDIR